MLLPPFSPKTRFIPLRLTDLFCKSARGRFSASDKLFSPSCELHVPPVVLTSRQPTPPHVTAHTSLYGGGGGFDDLLGGGRPVERGAWTAKTVKRPPQQPAQLPIRQLLSAADAQTAHHATSSTPPAHQRRGSANAETTPAGAPTAAVDRTQEPDATCEGNQHGHQHLSFARPLRSPPPLLLFQPLRMAQTDSPPPPRCIRMAVHRRRMGGTSPDPPLPPFPWTPCPPPPPLATHSEQTLR